MQSNSKNIKVKIYKISQSVSSAPRSKPRSKRAVTINRVDILFPLAPKSCKQVYDHYADK